MKIIDEKSEKSAKKKKKREAQILFLSCAFNGSLLAKLKKSIPLMLLP